MQKKFMINKITNFKINMGPVVLIFPFVSGSNTALHSICYQNPVLLKGSLQISPWSEGLEDCKYSGKFLLPAVRSLGQPLA